MTEPTLVYLADGRPVTRALVEQIEGEELLKLEQALGERNFSQGRFTEAAQLFEQVALHPDFLPAYDHIDL